MKKPKRKLKKNPKIDLEKFFTIILPAFSLLAAIILAVSFFWFSRNSQKGSRTYLTDGKFNPSAKVAYFNNQKIEPPAEPLPLSKAEEKYEKVLPATTEEKWVEVDLARQHLIAHEGDKVFMDVPISSGKWGRTRTGDFRIWIKLRYTLMHGGSQALGTYYYLPNVPCTQYFDGAIGLHGTYWHNNFGHVMSHGCVNMRTSDACQLFEWTSPPIDPEKHVAYPSAQYLGTRVIVHGEAPWE